MDPRNAHNVDGSDLSMTVESVGKGHGVPGDGIGAGGVGNDAVPANGGAVGGGCGGGMLDHFLRGDPCPGATLDDLRSALSGAVARIGSFRRERDVFRSRVESQTREVAALEKAVRALEGHFSRARRRYEDEIARLRVALAEAERHHGRQQGTLHDPARPPQTSPDGSPGQAAPFGAPPAPATSSRPSFSSGGSVSDLAAGVPGASPGAANGAAVGDSVGSGSARARESADYIHGGGAAGAHGGDGESRAAKRVRVADVAWSQELLPRPGDPLPHPSFNLERSLYTHSVPCCVRVSAEGRYLAMGCDGGAQVHELSTGALCGNFFKDTCAGGAGGDADGSMYVRAITFCPDERRIATGSADRVVRVWDIESRVIEREFRGHDLDVYSVDWLPDGRHLVSGSGDCTSKVWDLESGACVRTLGKKSVPGGIISVAVSVDGTRLATGSLDSILRIFDLETGALVDALEGHTKSVYSVRFGEDGRSVISGSLDGTVRVWGLGGGASPSAAAREPCAVLTGHEDYVLSVTAMHTNNWIASGSKDRSVLVWDPRRTSTPVVRLAAHENSVVSLSSPKSGKAILATGSGDHSTRVWSYTQVPGSGET